MVLQAWTNMAATIDDEARVVEDVDGIAKLASAAPFYATVVRGENRRRI